MPHALGRLTIGLVWIPVRLSGAARSLTHLFTWSMPNAAAASVQQIYCSTCDRVVERSEPHSRVRGAMRVRRRRAGEHASHG
jgi:hypothetical protein